MAKERPPSAAMADVVRWLRRGHRLGAQYESRGRTSYWLDGAPVGAPAVRALERRCMIRRFAGSFWYYLTPIGWRADTGDDPGGDPPLCRDLRRTAPPPPRTP